MRFGFYLQLLRHLEDAAVELAGDVAVRQLCFSPGKCGGVKNVLSVQQSIFNEGTQMRFSLQKLGRTKSFSSDQPSLDRSVNEVGLGLVLQVLLYQ